MAHIRIDPRFRKDLQNALNRAVTDPKHRAVIPDLLDEKAYLQAMKAAAKKEAAEAKEAKEAAKTATEPAPPATTPAEAPPQGKGGPEGPATA
jgi:peptidoglycan hydrolase CwlO-like protein